jgi:hypothetical protein
MRYLRCVLLGLAALLVGSCGSNSPKDLLLGKWENSEGKEALTLEFERDGTTRGQLGFLTAQGKYQWLDEKTIEVQIESPLIALASKNSESTIKLKYTLVSISRDELVVDDATGKTIRFKRVR